MTKVHGWIRHQPFRKGPVPSSIHLGAETTIVPSFLYPEKSSGLVVPSLISPAARWSSFALTRYSAGSTRHVFQIYPMEELHEYGVNVRGSLVCETNYFGQRTKLGTKSFATARPDTDPLAL